LLYPKPYTLQIAGGKKCEEFPLLAGAQFCYRIEEWDLTNATEVNVGQTSIPVEPDFTGLQPYLEGNELHGVLHLKGEPCIFVGPPPDIAIPLPPQRDPSIEAQRWRITIVTMRMLLHILFTWQAFPIP
jgi:hypothetical protein